MDTSAQPAIATVYDVCNLYSPLAIGVGPASQKAVYVSAAGLHASLFMGILTMKSINERR